MKLEIRHLQLVQAIAQEGSVTGAGNRLHLTQPALSRQLRDAEKRLGVALFLRLKKGMVLTPAGEELLDSARKILEQLQRAEERAGNAKSGAIGLLRLSTECLTCYHWLPSRLSLFRKKWPGVEIRIAVEATPCPAQFLLEGKIDVAIVSSKVNNRKLIRTPLFRDELVAVLSPRHPLATRPFVTARDFSDQHLFVYNMPLERNRVFREILLPEGVTPQRVTQMQLTEAILELVKAGLGVGVLARWAAARELDSKSVVGVPITPRGMHRQWSAMSMKTDFSPSYRSDFISVLARTPFSSKD